MLSGCVGMVKNEVDVIDCWVDHVLSRLDVLYMVDHGSSDGTAERLQSLKDKWGEKLHLFHFCDPGSPRRGR